MQTLKQQNALSVVNQRILAHRDSDTKIPEHLIDQLIKLTETTGGRDHAAALRMKADQLLGQDRICEALIAYETAIAQYPEDLGLQMGVSGFFARANARLTEIGQFEPQSAEIGRSYERLMDLGVVSLKLQFIAIKYYSASGEISKACELALKLHRSMPCHPELREAITHLGALTDDARILGITMGRTSTPNVEMKCMAGNSMKGIANGGVKS